MTKDDRVTLADFVKDYSLKDIISTLKAICSDEADSWSDFGLKDKAREYAEVADLLGDLSDVLEDSDI